MSQRHVQTNSAFQASFPLLDINLWRRFSHCFFWFDNQLSIVIQWYNTNSTWWKYSVIPNHSVFTDCFCLSIPKFATKCSCDYYERASCSTHPIIKTKVDVAEQTNNYLLTGHWHILIVLSFSCSYYHSTSTHSTICDLASSSQESISLLVIMPLFIMVSKLSKNYHQDGITCINKDSGVTRPSTCYQVGIRYREAEAYNPSFVDVCKSTCSLIQVTFDDVLPATCSSWMSYSLRSSRM